MSIFKRTVRFTSNKTGRVVEFKIKEPPRRAKIERPNPFKIRKVRRLYNRKKIV